MVIIISVPIPDERAGPRSSAVKPAVNRGAGGGAGCMGISLLVDLALAVGNAHVPVA